MEGHLSTNAPSGFLLKRRTGERFGNTLPSNVDSDSRLTLLSTHVYG